MLRSATADDAGALESFPLGGQPSVWLDEVAEMVLAVRFDQRRSGVATLLLESVLADMQLRGVMTADWLVHPRNLGSIQFSRTTFHEASETYPPDDRPYVRFTLRL